MKEARRKGAPNFCDRLKKVDRGRAPLTVAAVFLISLFSLLLSSTYFGASLSIGGYDLMLKARVRLLPPRSAAEDSDVVIIALDDFTLSNPRLSIPELFQHHYYTEIIKQLHLAGAEAVALHLILPRTDAAFFSQADVSEWFEVIKNVAADMPVISGMRWRPLQSPLLPAPEYLKIMGADSIGFLNAARDKDEKVRRQPLRRADCFHGPGCLSLPYLAAKAFRPELEVAGQEIYIDFDPRPAPQFSFVDVYQRAADGETDFFQRHFKGKLVLIGEINSLTRGNYPTPFSEKAERGDTAVEIAAQSIITILRGHQLTTLGPGSSFIFIVALTLAALTPLFFSQRCGPYPLIWLPSAVMALGLLVIASAFALGLYLPLAPSLIAIFVAQFFYLGIRNKEGREATRTSITALSLYLNPALAGQIVHHPEILSRVGQRREMTVFFSDLVGFTSLAERSSPEELVTILNRYFEKMSSGIEEYGGILDKYSGDSVMAFWGSPLRPRQDHAQAAVLSAIRQQDILKELNRDLLAEGRPALVALMGVNTGPMVVGNIGAETRLTYTVMGDAVNLASRLVAVNKIYRSRIIINETTAQAASDVAELRALDRVRVPGRQESLMIYEVMTRRGELGGEDKRARDLFERGLLAYFNRDFSAAKELFEDALDLWPEDVPSVIMRARCRDFIKSPPPDDWSSVTMLGVK
ncbi:MAG: CHASE2 domain-containing protein [Candidatus Adiutrix sp.]|nr:CHASE2 domain-containing protein [Candidatus Adiutrix sp.]